MDETNENQMVIDMEENYNIVERVCNKKRCQTTTSSYFSRASSSPISSKIFKLEDLEYNLFLQFTNKDDEAKYREYTWHQIYGPMYIFFLLFLLSLIFTRTVSFHVDTIPLHVASLLLFIIGVVLLLVLIVGRHLKLLTMFELPSQVQCAFDYIIHRIFRNELESILTLLFSLRAVLNLVVRVIIGSCPSHVSVTESLNCNPLAASNSPPIDSIMICFALALYMQLFFKNVRKSVLVFIWILSAAAVLWSFHYLHNWTQIWVFSGITIFPMVQYECERVQMSNFLKSKQLLDQEQQKRNAMAREHADKEMILSQLNEAKLKEEKNRVDLEILELSNKNEVKLKEAETGQLRLLVGNVAHDLKTPIHCLTMDLEILKESYNDATRRFPGFCSSNSGNKHVDPMAIFGSLESTCAMMTMSINRCLDYTKASSNIDLVPSMERFDIISTLSSTIAAVNHHLHQNRIIVHLLNRDACPHVVSDNRWFSENLFGILSNAIKYSDKNTNVDVKLELVTSDHVGCNFDQTKSSNSQKHEVSESNTTFTLKSFTCRDKLDSEHVEVVCYPLSAETLSLPRNFKTSSQSSGAKSNQIDSIETADENISQSRHTMIRVSVEDRGVGIPEDDRKNLFQPFKQSQRRTGGTGLGLYSLYKRMEALKGYCGVDARSDGLNGSVFWFAFPYRPDYSYAATNSSKSLTSCTNQVISNKSAIYKNIISLRILVVDDSNSILKVTTRLLGSKGHEVEVEENGSLGLQRMKNSLLTQDFDVLLTDLQMPVMDGFLFVNRLREYEKEMLAQGNDMSSLRKCHNRHGKLLIIGMSANSDDVSKQEALSSGMDHFIAKPFFYEDFERVLQSYI